MGTTESSHVDKRIINDILCKGVRHDTSFFYPLNNSQSKSIYTLYQDALLQTTDQKPLKRRMREEVSNLCVIGYYNDHIMMAFQFNQSNKPYVMISIQGTTLEQNITLIKESTKMSKVHDENDSLDYQYTPVENTHLCLTLLNVKSKDFYWVTRVYRQ